MQTFLKMVVNLLCSISLLNQAFFSPSYHLRVFPNAICSKKGRSLLLLHYKIFCMQDGMAICFSSILSHSFLFLFAPKSLWKDSLPYSLPILISPKNCASYWWACNYPREAWQWGHPIESNEAFIFCAPADHGRIICPWLDLTQEGGISSLTCTICRKKRPTL